MRPKLFVAGIWVVALSASASFASPLPISEVVAMSRSGARPQDVIERVRASQTSYALRGSDFGKLKAVGVSDEVLDYLQQAFVSDVDLLTRYSLLGPHLGGCSYCYPQPVDLDRMVSGFGIASSDVPGHRRGGLPAGVPDWVSPSLGAAGKQVSASDIIDMSKRGVPDSQVIDLLHRSSLEHVIGIGGYHIVREHAVTGVSGSQLARWRSEGVSDAVLDALQGRFLAQLIELNRLRYQNWL